MEITGFHACESNIATVLCFFLLDHWFCAMKKATKVRRFIQLDRKVSTSPAVAEEKNSDTGTDPFEEFHFFWYLEKAFLCLIIVYWMMVSIIFYLHPGSLGK